MKRIPFIFLSLLLAHGLIAQGEYHESAITKVVFLGTGTPNPDPGHSGGSVAIVVNDTPYIVDFGPGLIRNAAAHSPSWGGTIPGLEVENIKRAFLTHLHSDHTVGLPDLILTPWVMGRDEPLEIYGPEGIADMTHHILKAYEADIHYRLYGLEPANNQGWRVEAKEIEEGMVYEDENVRVEAFLVEHGTWPQAFGYRFTTPDRVIVISGDTRPSDNLVKYSIGADILVHEVYSQEKWEGKDEFWRRYHKANHTSTIELAKIAEQCKPGLVILYHSLSWGATETEMLEEISRIYGGRVVFAQDRDVY